MKVNVFRLKAALADLDGKGIEIGDVVTVSWDVDDAYGGGTRSHTGPLASLDRSNGWFEVKPTPRSPGHLRGTLTSMGSRMELIQKSGKPDSKVATKSKKNPFLEKAKKA